MDIKNWFSFTSLDGRIKKSAGIVIILKKNKILLCHATNSKWTNTFGPPKGGVDKGEIEIDGAIRELKEETSITIDKNKIDNPKKPIIIDYQSKNREVYKRLFLYLVYIDDISEIGLLSETIPKSKLQIGEIDWCGFLTKKEAKKRISQRLSHLLFLLKNNDSYS